MYLSEWQVDLNNSLESGQFFRHKKAVKQVVLKYCAMIISGVDVSKTEQLARSEL